jgi:hypothetical protein
MKKIPKLTKSKLKEFEVAWRSHNKDMKRQSLHELRYNTLDDYIKYRFGLIKTKQEFKNYEPKSSYRRETKYYPSLDSKSSPTMVSPKNPTARKESPRYTGTLIKGISQTHKSNAVPIISDIEAKEHARMRR